MKTLPILAATFALLLPAFAADPAKPLVALTAKRHLLDSDHDLRARRGSTEEKTVTLRVEITNTSSAPLNGATLSGIAIVTRAGENKEKVVKETLTAMPVPAMKPNERLTLDLGKIQLSEAKWADRKFEETLDEWQVTCTLDGKSVGVTTSSDNFAKLEKDAVTPKREPGPNQALRKARRGR